MRWAERLRAPPSNSNIRAIAIIHDIQNHRIEIMNNLNCARLLHWHGCPYLEKQRGVS